MPRGYSNWGSHARPDARLFHVNQTPLQQLPARPDEEATGSLNDLEMLVESLMEEDNTDQLLGGNGLLPNGVPPAPFVNAPPPMPQATMFTPQQQQQPQPLPLPPPQQPQQPPALQHAAVAAAAAAPSREPLPEVDFTWTEREACLLATDAHGTPIARKSLPTVGTNELQVDCELSPALLYWADRRQWMWHKKWALPTLTVRVSHRGKAASGLGNLSNGLDGERLYAMVTAGTLRDDAPDILHDQGMDGECQRLLDFDASGHAELSFTRLLFQRTSFNCGNRPFRIVVTIISAPPRSAQAGAAAPGGALASEEPEPLTPLACICSCSVHVDARKRSKSERPDAKDDDIRLVQRQRPGGQQAAAAAARPAGEPNWFTALTGLGGGPSSSQQANCACERHDNAIPALLHAAGDSFIEVRADGVVVQIHSASAYGYAPTQLLGRSLLTICHPDDRAGLLQTMQALLMMANAQHHAGPAAAASLMAAAGRSGGMPRSVRVLHRVVLGLGSQQTPEPLVIDSVLCVARANTSGGPPQTLFVCSRSALPVGEAGAPFAFKVVPHPMW